MTSQVSEASAVVGVHDFRKLSKSRGSEHTTREVRTCTIRFFEPPLEAVAQSVLDGGYAATPLDLNSPYGSDGVSGRSGSRGISGISSSSGSSGGELNTVDMLSLGGAEVPLPPSPELPSDISAAANAGPVLAVIEVHGAGFLRHMVRAIAKALLDVGFGRAGRGHMATMLDKGGGGSSGGGANSAPDARKGTERESAADFHRQRKAAGGGCLAAAAKNLWLVRTTRTVDVAVTGT